MASPYYITTAIDYVNGAPHLGHAYEKIATDVMARFQRLMGREVFFLTGTDEHGVKIQQSAEAKGVEPKAYVDDLVDSFKATWAHCGVQYDRFIRTTDAEHYALVADIWRHMVAQDDIYKASYEGKYCSGCEAFLTERDLTEDGLCAIHQTRPETVIEENYFFRLSKYKDVLKQHFAAHPDFIQPAFRQQEVLKMLDDLQDISVSRSKQSVRWGIPVPDDDEQVIYVWIDALSNYLTGLGYQVNGGQHIPLWQSEAGESNTVHVIGKDILRFHALYWPAMLLSLNVALPKQIIAHGFITLADEKISKSLGNVIAPQDITAHYDLPNADALRYYLMASTAIGSDGNFTSEEFKLRINADLANNVGNLLNRTVSMLKKYFEHQVPERGSCQKFEELYAVEPLAGQIADAYERFAFNEALELALSKVDVANKLINEAEPWTLYKEGQTEALKCLMRGLCETLRQVSIYLLPVTPNLSAKVAEQLGYGSIDTWTWASLEESIPAGQVTHPLGPILPRLDSELVGASGKK